MSDTSGSQYSAQTADLGIDELRLIYDREESRNNTFESKAAALFGFSSLLISILIFTLNSVLSSPNNISLTFDIISIINVTGIVVIVIGIFIISLSLINLINVLKIRKYLTPFAFDPNDIHFLLKMPLKDLKNDIIEDYRRSIPHFACINKKKADSLDKAINMLKFGVPISIIPLIILSLIKVVT